MAKQLDVEAFSQRRTTLSYPNIFLGEVNISTAIVLQALEEGVIPVIGENNGEKRIIKSISASAFNIDKLLRVHRAIYYNKSEAESIKLESIKDYMEVIEWTF